MRCAMCADKQSLRRFFRAQRAAQSSDARTAQANAIAARVLSHPIYAHAQTIFCYCARAEEIDTHAILQAALQAGKCVCVPRCTGPGIMSAYAILDLQQLLPGAYGILEPPADLPAIAPEQIDLCLAPCLAADRSGYRLGYGGGYYDRFFAKMTGVRAALCAADRLLDAPLPQESTDLPCHVIFTETEVLVPREK